MHSLAKILLHCMQATTTTATNTHDWLAAVREIEPTFDAVKSGFGFPDFTGRPE